MTGFALSGYAENIGNVAQSVTGSFQAISSLIGGAAYLAGLGFGVGALLKFKAHRDAPTQVPIGTPFTMLGIAVLLIYLPSLLTTTGSTIFSSGGVTGGAYGLDFGGIGATSKEGSDEGSNKS